jgi:allophanate hydrolase
VNTGIAQLLKAYRDGATTPRAVVEELIARKHEADPFNVWICRVDDEALRARADELALLPPASLPLYGIPFAIKDNIDCAPLPTTAGCAAFSYTPTVSAHVVQRLVDAGAIVIGKTNLDQFATGLVGTRSPFGVCRNKYDLAYISGGSSSGSALAVALGQASFALGTDTAGSGRVPAAFNNLVGYKPTLGRLSTRGMVPACLSLDAMSIFAATAGDAALVAGVAADQDLLDPWSRAPALATGRGWSQRATFRFAVPQVAQREFMGNAQYARLFELEISHLEKLGGEPVIVDITPLLECARLLYQGPWVAERYLAAMPLIESDPAALLTVTRDIIAAGTKPSARDAFLAQYRLQELRRVAATIWAQADVLLLPTAPTHFTIDEVAAEPIARNTDLGYYTNFVNLMDLAAVAVPAGFTDRGLPFGVSLIAPAWTDDDLLRLASRMQQAGAPGITPEVVPEIAHGAPGFVDIAVCGAHMSGLPLNTQLTSRGAWLLSTTQTTAEYRLYALPGGPPFRPGLVRVGNQGTAIEVEIWRMPVEHFGSFVAGIPSPLGIGRLKIADGTEVSGFVCETHALAQAADITRFGGWRRYLARG